MEQGDYTVSDVEVVLSRGDFADWDDAIRWLAGWGRTEVELSEQSVERMIEDFRRAKLAGAPFTRDAEQVHEAARRTGGL